MQLATTSQKLTPNALVNFEFKKGGRKSAGLILDDYDMPFWLLFEIIQTPII